MSRAISIQNLNKSFANSVIFKDFNLHIKKGEITVIFGPNGSGKTTLLNILSGITNKDSGEIYIDNFHSYSFSYIFQNYRDALLPWRTNFENIALPLQIQKKEKKIIEQEVAELQNLFKFTCNWSDYPYKLSGGQQQILSFMRALITKPKLLFIDEPFSALDYENNLLLRERLQKYYLVYKPTILLVTHNIEEAVHLAKTVYVFSQKQTKIVEKINNTLPYPRTIKTLKSPAFNTLKNRILSTFQETTII